MAYAKVKEVKALEQWNLSLLFDNGIRKTYDVSLLFDEFPDMFFPLIQNPSIFPHVSVDCGGCAVAWSDEIDISECELWERGVEEPEGSLPFSEMEKNGRTFQFYP